MSSFLSNVALTFITTVETKNRRVHNDLTNLN
jgi:hypothetical protein